MWSSVSWPEHFLAPSQSLECIWHIPPLLCISSSGLIWHKQKALFKLSAITITQNLKVNKQATPYFFYFSCILGILFVFQVSYECTFNPQSLHGGQVGSSFPAAPSWLGLGCPTGSRELPSWLAIDLLMSDDLKLESFPCSALCWKRVKPCRFSLRLEKGIFPPLKIKRKGRRKS